MSNKNIAIGTVAVLLTIISIVLATELYLTLQGINSAAVVAAITVVVIGVAWFRKTSKS